MGADVGGDSVNALKETGLAGRRLSGVVGDVAHAESNGGVEAVNVDDCLDRLDERVEVSGAEWTT